MVREKGELVQREHNFATDEVDSVQSMRRELH